MHIYQFGENLSTHPGDRVQTRGYADADADPDADADTDADRIHTKTGMSPLGLGGHENVTLISIHTSSKQC